MNVPPLDPDRSSIGIEVRELSYCYPGASSRTLHQLSFALHGGEVYGFLGPSGAGKSTTQKILYRLLAGYHGSVRLGGREIRDWDNDLYSLMGIGFETPSLYLKLTGRENLEFALSLHRSNRAADMARMTGPGDITRAAARLGLDDVIDRRVETYSKGMRMRLAFIRAVLHRPQLLFLDEPTSGLDPGWSRRVKDWILELRSDGCAVFLTTHAMELADELCDVVGFLVDGRLALQDNPAALKRRYGRSGCVVTGRTAKGAPCRRELSYEQLRTGGHLTEFAAIEHVHNQEVNLEQVFLTVTGRSLSADNPAALTTGVAQETA